MKKQLFGMIAALFAFMVMLPVCAYAANVYAILYEDGTLVFQHGDTPETGRAVKETYKVRTTDLAPWYNERDSIFAVNFAEQISPTSTASWFYACSKLERVDNIQNLDTANVTDMRTMFHGCSALLALDLSTWDTAKVKDMSTMFHGCSALSALDVSNFNTANVRDMEDMFYGCSKLTALDVSNFNTANVTNMRYMFYGCSGLKTLDISKFDTANVTNMSSMFEGCSALKTLDVSKFNTAKVTDMPHMFYGCSGLTALDVSNFNTTNVWSMSYMFSGCSGLKALNVSKFDTARVTDMYQMFYNCSGLTVLDVSKFDTANVRDMYGMFSGCSGLTMLDVSRFDTTSVGGMGVMFSSCRGLTALDVSNFDTERVHDMGGMFAGCSNLKAIYASDSFTTEFVTESSYMFSSCDSLVGGNGTAFDQSHMNKEYARIDTASAPGYFTDKAFKPVTYEIINAVTENENLSVTLDNSGAATLAVSYFDASGKFVSAHLQDVEASAGTVEISIPSNTKTAHVMLLDGDFRPLCAARSVENLNFTPQNFPSGGGLPGKPFPNPKRG